MKNHNIENLVKYFLYIAIISSVTSIVVFFTFPIDDTTSAHADASMAFSTVFVILLGLLAVLITVNVESSEYKAKEKVKEDIMSLQMLLTNSITKLQSAKINNYKADLEKEGKAIYTIINSSTGYALASWVAHKSANNQVEKFRNLFYDLNTLINRIENHESDNETLIRTLVEVLDYFDDLTEEDLKLITKYLSNILNSISNFKNYINESPIINASVDITEEQKNVNETSMNNSYVNEANLESEFNFLKEQFKGQEKLVEEVTSIYQSILNGDKDQLIVWNALLNKAKKSL
jgi:predicted PurR-regulated permease PerM